FHYRILEVLGISRGKLDRLLQHHPGKAIERSTALLDLAAALAIDRTVALCYAAHACAQWPSTAVREAILSCALSAFLCDLSIRLGHAPDLPLLTLPASASVEPSGESGASIDLMGMDEAI